MLEPDIKRTLIVFVLCFLTWACRPAESTGQVDPDWLRSWNEAVEQRPKTLTSQSRIAAKREPGTPFSIRGQVVGPSGEALGGVMVHAYHRDEAGFDFGDRDNELTTWRLQGWAVTDEAGWFEFATVRPGTDHLGREAAHVHFTLVSETYGRQWAPKVSLGDDPLVTDAQRQRSRDAGDFATVV
ncbi:MAG: hypothetical protein AAGI08_15565, partial [Bacteroidota bacterium]